MKNWEIKALFVVVLIIGAWLGYYFATEKKEEKIPPKAISTEPISCENVGPLNCQMISFNDVYQACEALRSCLVGKVFEPDVVKDVVHCDKPWIAADGVSATVSAEVDVGAEGPPLHANFLLVQFPGGWCPAGAIHNPAWTEGRSCNVIPKTEWDGGTKALMVSSQRVCETFKECRSLVFNVDYDQMNAEQNVVEDIPCEE